MTPPVDPSAAAELLRTAVDATAAACDAYRQRAIREAEPLDYRLALYLECASHYLSAAHVAAGGVPLSPEPMDGPRQAGAT